VHAQSFGNLLQCGQSSIEIYEIPRIMKQHRYGLEHVHARRALLQIAALAREKHNKS